MAHDAVSQSSVLARVVVLDTRFGAQPFTGLVWLARAPAVGDAIAIEAVDAGLIVYPMPFIRIHEVELALHPTTIIPSNPPRQVQVYDLRGLWSPTA